MLFMDAARFPNLPEMQLQLLHLEHLAHPRIQLSRVSSVLAVSEAN